MWNAYYAPGSVAEALALLARHGDACRAIAGGTDLIPELERGMRSQRILVDVSRIPGLDAIACSGGEDGGTLSIGATTTHNQVAASPAAVAHAFPLARACWQVGAPQLRNRGTVAGNLITASPANDTIAALRAMDARVIVASQARGERTTPLSDFFLGVRRTVLAPDELLVRIEAPTLRANERGTFLKLRLRQAKAISLVNAAVILAFGDEDGRTVAGARIALGSVGPTILRAAEAEAFLAGRALTDDVIAEAAALAAAATRPISDIRASAEYRRDMARVLVARALRQLRDGAEREGWPERPVLLRTSRRQPAAEPPTSGSEPLAPCAPGRDDSLGPRSEDFSPHRPASSQRPPGGSIRLILNGRPITLHGVTGKTLLRALREDAGLTGVKEGCAEGECGACTVWLDGAAVMSCLVPAERADGCEVVTVEGLAGPAAGGSPAPGDAGEPGRLHPIQQAFIDAGAVQCGYCTPGFLMAAAKLLEEVPQPTETQVKEALVGNLCRCTGYAKIVEAVDRAGRREAGSQTLEAGGHEGVK